MHSKYLLGILAVIFGAIALSFTGLLMRNVESADAWQILFYRSVGMIFTMSVFLILTQRAKFFISLKNIGWRGFLAAFLVGPSFGLYILALTMSSVAEVSFVISTLPLFTALLAWIFLKENVGRSTWVAVFIVLVGISIMLFDNVTQGGQWLGIVVAFGVPSTFAATIVLIRSGRDTDMLPAIWVAGFIALAMAIGLSGGNISSIPSNDIWLGILMGGILGVGFSFYTVGARYVPAAQVGLLALLEQVFNPIWAWAGVGEVPTVLVLVGGLVVLGAILVRSVMGVIDEKNNV